MKKQSQIQEQNPKYVADEIKNIIKIMVSRMSPEAQQRAFPNIKNRLKDFNTIEISNKKNPGGASIGASLSLIKNILNGRDPYFVYLVVEELKQVL
jgi:hypothetical protein